MKARPKKKSRAKTRAKSTLQPPHRRRRRPVAVHTRQPRPQPAAEPASTPGTSAPETPTDSDVERLRLIQQLTSEVGLNLAGVERVLYLQDELGRMHRRLERLEREMQGALADVHRSYRRELVLYQPPKPPASRK